MKMAIGDALELRQTMHQMQNLRAAFEARTRESAEDTCLSAFGGGCATENKLSWSSQSVGHYMCTEGVGGQRQYITFAYIRKL